MTQKCFSRRTLYELCFVNCVKKGQTGLRIRRLLQKMQLTQSRKLRQNAALKIPKILAQRDKAAKYKEGENLKRSGQGF